MDDPKYIEDCIRLANNNQEVPTQEILEDIRETEQEIFQYQQKLWLFYGWKLDAGYRNEIKKREEFIEKLKKILIGRELLRDGANSL